LAYLTRRRCRTARFASTATATLDPGSSGALCCCVLCAFCFLHSALDVVARRAALKYAAP